MSFKSFSRGFAVGRVVLVLALVAVVGFMAMPVLTRVQGAKEVGECETQRKAVALALAMHEAWERHISEQDQAIEAGQEKKFFTELFTKVYRNRPDKALCPLDGKTEFALTYLPASRTFRIFCPNHNAVKMSPAQVLSQPYMLHQISELFDQTQKVIGRPFNRIDSGATVLPASAASTFERLFHDRFGYTLADVGARTWRYNPSTKMFYWTYVDINNPKVADDTVLPVMRFNPQTNAYTVWECTVQLGKSNTGATYVVSYQTIETTESRNLMADLSHDEQTYDKAMEVLEKATKRRRLDKTE